MTTPPQETPYRETLPKEPSPSLPPSVTHFGANMGAIAIVVAVMYGMRIGKVPSNDAVLLLCLSLIIPVVAFDVLVLRVHKRQSTGLDWDKAIMPNTGRVAIKLLGLVGTIAPFAILYWFTPEYQGSFYDPFYNTLRRFWIPLVVIAITYTWFVDGLMKEPFDVYWQLGRVVLGRWRDAKIKDVANHYRGWFIKAYFFALFWVWMTHSTHNILHFDLSNASWSNLRGYDFAYEGIFFIDLLLATVGYTMTFRVFDSHIRSAEPTMTGWVFALVCYEPFFSGLFEKQYLHYGGNTFGDWLAPHPTVRWIWAGAIIFLITIYVLATVVFGVRFSNLTHRGILTNGPYRFTKHPAYVSKNISWWLASVPFVVRESVEISIKHCIALGAINFIYFMRARTEERHLSRDPTYVEYAMWMNEHGTLAFLGRWIPFFRYRPPSEHSQPESWFRALFS